MINQVKLNIKEKAKKHNLTIGELCKRLGRDRLYIYRMTNGVGLEKIVRIANAIGCSPGELLAGL